jgi:uncharacterized protein YbcV (DUF1398 family)
MTQLDKQLSRAEADKIYDTVDSDKSGQISYEEFLEAIKNNAWFDKLKQIKIKHYPINNDILETYEENISLTNDKDDLFELDVNHSNLTDID